MRITGVNVCVMSLTSNDRPPVDLSLGDLMVNQDTTFLARDFGRFWVGKFYVGILLVSVSCVFFKQAKCVRGFFKSCELQFPANQKTSADTRGESIDDGIDVDVSTTTIL